MFEIIFGFIYLVWQGIWWGLKGLFHIFIFLFTVKIIRVITITALIIFVPLIIMYFVSPGLGETASYIALSAVNSTNLYNYSKDIYLDSIIHGNLRVFDYTTQREMPYYSLVVPVDKLEDTEPLGYLPVNSDVVFRSVFETKKKNKKINKEENDEETGEVKEIGEDKETGEDEKNVWVEVLFYDEEKPQYGYVPLPAAEWTQIAPQITRVHKAEKSTAVYATAAVQGLRVRSGPSQNYDIQFNLLEHTRVEVVERYDNTPWVKIRYGNNEIGYVNGDYLSY